MPVERKRDAPPEIVQGGRSFGRISIEIHLAPHHLCRSGRGGEPSSGAIVGVGMVNGALRPKAALRKQQGMAGSTPLAMAAATRPSVRAALIAATVISAATLAIATFELSMAD